MRASCTARPSQIPSTDIATKPAITDLRRIRSLLKGCEGMSILRASGSENSPVRQASSVGCSSEAPEAGQRFFSFPPATERDGDLRLQRWLEACRTRGELERLVCRSPTPPKVDTDVQRRISCPFRRRAASETALAGAFVGGLLLFCEDAADETRTSVSNNDRRSNAQELEDLRDVVVGQVDAAARHSGAD